MSVGRLPDAIAALLLAFFRVAGDRGATAKPAPSLSEYWENVCSMLD